MPVKQKKRTPYKKVANLLRALGQPARLRILTAIGEGQACVCHLEAALGYRQAYISQHLMALRQAGLVRSVKEGRYVFYSLEDPRLLALIRQSAALCSLSDPALAINDTHTRMAGCPCPHCDPEGTFTPPDIPLSTLETLNNQK